MKIHLLNHEIINIVNDENIAVSKGKDNDTYTTIKMALWQRLFT